MVTCAKQTSDYEFGIIGCQRSGHHALVSWLARHFLGRVVHINMLKLVRGNSDVLNQFTYMNGIISKHVPPDRHSKCLIWSMDRFDFSAEVLRDEEKHHIKSLNFAVLPNDTKNNPRIIIVMRDPYNWMASRYKAMKERKISEYGDYKKGIDSYKQHLVEFLNPTILPANTIPVNFNH